MRIIMIAIGSEGDVRPFISLGKALVRRGHPVTVCSLPAFATTIEHNGLEFAAICDETTGNAAMSDSKPRGSRTSFSARWKALSGMLEPVYEYIAARRHDDIVVVGSLWALGARVAQEKFGMPYLSVQVSPATLISAHLPPVHPRFKVPQGIPLVMRKMLCRTIEYLKMDRICAPQINALRHKKGLQGTVKHVFSQWMHAPDGVICLFPEWFAPVQQDWPQPLHMTGFPLSERTDESLDDELQAFLRAGQPPIVFAPGAARQFDEHFYPLALSILQKLGARGIFLGEHRAPLKRLPLSALQREHAPMGALLPHTAGLVHSGAIGTMSLALAAGVGQIVMPAAHDQFDNAERLVRMGCGIKLSLPLDEARLRDALIDLLEDARMVAACARTRQLSPPATLACEHAASIIERCRPPTKPRLLRTAS
ncbi:glycosyltransferase [Pseudomonas purpurea]|uniref:glycosyltransferase n=1 Tax=Pseudomonas purpurea TaxID=3136737 RepID=UPI003262E235